MVRPLLVANFPRIVGGGELSLLDLARELDRRGHRPILAVPEDPHVDASPGAPLLGEGLDQRVVPFELVAAARQIRAHAKEADVIHVTGPRGLVAASLARSGRPILWHVRVAARDKLDPFLSRLPDLIIANSRATASRFGGRAKVRVVYNGIRVADVSTERLPIEPGRRAIGVIGRMTPEKGHLDLLGPLVELLRRREDLQVVFVGDDSGAIGDKIRAGAAEFPERMTLLGVVPGIASMMNQFTVIIVPSLVEGFGRVAAEALLAGVPVVARRVGGLVEVLAQLPDPWLPDRLRDWSSRIESEIDDPRCAPEDLRRFGARFDFKRHVDQIVACYESVMTPSVAR